MDIKVSMTSCATKAEKQPFGPPGGGGGSRERAEIVSLQREVGACSNRERLSPPCNPSLRRAPGGHEQALAQGAEKALQRASQFANLGRSRKKPKTLPPRIGYGREDLTRHPYYLLIALLVVRHSQLRLLFVLPTAPKSYIPTSTQGIVQQGQALLSTPRAGVTLRVIYRHLPAKIGRTIWRGRAGCLMRN